MHRLFLLTALLTGLAGPAVADTVQVAVAANFAATLQTLATDFQQQSGHVISPSSGSTGKLYAQIRHDAPFDVFLAADRERPALLHAQGLATAPVIYAIGRLALYAPAGEPRARLDGGDFTHLAIANPLTAPYGAAARAVLEGMGRWTMLQPRLVMGENIGQTFQFTHSGNAELGFVALAQVRALNIPQTQYWTISADRHPALEQTAVLLRGSRVPEAASLFLEYLQSGAARTIIERDGYGVPYDDR